MLVDEVDCDVQKVTSVVVCGIMVEEVVVVEETVNVDRASVVVKGTSVVVDDGGSYCVKTTVEVTEINIINNHYYSCTKNIGKCYKT